MDFQKRIKKEMTEGIVRAILEDAGYQVVDTGIEKVLREISPMSEDALMQLGIPYSMWKLPDLTAFNPDKTEKFLIEVKYRSAWGKNLLEEISGQVKVHKNLVLVSINANPPNQYDGYYPSTYLRCCRVKHENEVIKVQLRGRKEDKSNFHYWKALDEIVDGEWLWWAMSPMEEIFPLLKDLDDNTTLQTAIKAIEGILTLPNERDKRDRKAS